VQPSTSAAQRSVLASDIEQQADRLAFRLRAEASFAPPSRNLFRFSGRVESQATQRPAVIPPATQETAPPPPSPPPLRATLSGIATDTVGDKEQRTGILSTPAGVLFVHEGDIVAGQYRVRTIEAESLELVRLDDGGVLRLSLSTPKAQ
jgi:hypothetical protein